MFSWLKSVYKSEQYLSFFDSDKTLQQFFLLELLYRSHPSHISPFWKLRSTQLPILSSLVLTSKEHYKLSFCVIPSTTIRTQRWRVLLVLIEVDAKKSCWNVFLVDMEISSLGKITSLHYKKWIFQWSLKPMLQKPILDKRKQIPYNKPWSVS